LRGTLWHPFAKIRIPADAPGILLEVDSWLESQIKKGLVKEL